jgi:hypothetical protein
VALSEIQKPTCSNCRPARFPTLIEAAIEKNPFDVDRTVVVNCGVLDSLFAARMAA